MPDPAERFVTAATAPLAGNAELELAARRMLEGSIASNGGEIPAAAIARLEAAPGRWRTILWIVALLGASAVAVSGFLQWRAYLPWVKMISAIGGSSSGTSFSGPSPEELLARGLTPQQRLILLGDLSKRSIDERWKALHESDPQNPEYYVEYVLAYHSKHDALPPDFLETGKRIDPDNAWFPAYAGGILADEAVDADKRTPAQIKAKAPKTYTVKDAAKLKEARELFRQAARLPAFDLRQGELFRQRVELLPRRTTAFDHIPTMVHVAGMRAASIPLRYLSDAIAAEGARLAAENDPQGLRELIADWDTFIAVYARANDSTMVDVLVKMVVVANGYRELGRASERLGLADEASRLQAVADRYDAYNDRRKAANEALEPEREELAREMSLIHGLTIPSIAKQVADPPDLRERLKPGRLAEHELAMKYMILLLLGPILLVSGLCLALYCFRGSELLRLLSARLVLLLTARDWAMILGIGVALPFIGHQVLARLPWTGCREWGIGPLKFITPAVGVTLVTCLMLILPVVLARLCLEKRAGFLGIHWRFPWVAQLICLLIALAIPVAGQALLPWKPNTALALLALLVIIGPECWIAVAALRGIFSRPENLLQRLLLSRVLLPAHAIGVVFAVIAIPVCNALEKHWAQRDELSAITPEAAALSRFEYEVTQTARRDILDILQLPR